MTLINYTVKWNTLHTGRKIIYYSKFIKMSSVFSTSTLNTRSHDRSLQYRCLFRKRNNRSIPWDFLPLLKRWSVALTSANSLTIPILIRISQNDFPWFRPNIPFRVRRRVDGFLLPEETVPDAYLRAKFICEGEKITLFSGNDKRNDRTRETNKPTNGKLTRIERQSRSARHVEFLLYI